MTKFGAAVDAAVLILLVVALAFTVMWKHEQANQESCAVGPNGAIICVDR